jgi:hypothetical protein
MPHWIEGRALQINISIPFNSETVYLFPLWLTLLMVFLQHTPEGSLRIIELQSTPLRSANLCFPSKNVKKTSPRTLEVAEFAGLTIL